MRAHARSSTAHLHEDVDSRIHEAAADALRIVEDSVGGLGGGEQCAYTSDVVRPSEACDAAAADAGAHLGSEAKSTTNWSRGRLGATGAIREAARDRARGDARRGQGCGKRSRPGWSWRDMDTKLDLTSSSFWFLKVSRQRKYTWPHLGHTATRALLLLRAHSQSPSTWR